MLRLLILAALGAGAYYAYKKYMTPQGTTTGAMSEPDEMYDAAAIHRDADQPPAGAV